MVLNPRIRDELKSCTGTKHRQGAATVELAFALILLVVLTVGSIEVCNLIYLKQSLAQTAYDGGMRALRPGVVEDDVRQQIEQLLAARYITGAQITITGSSEPFNDVDRGETFYVRIRAAADGNVSVAPWLLNVDDIEAEVAGRKQ